MTATSIEWTRGDDGTPGATWNPVRGCSRVSAGCTHCYAERMAARNLPEMRSPSTGKPFAVRGSDGPHWTGAVELIPSKLAEPLHWRKPRRVFVNSMSDLFHEGLPFEQITACYGVMAASMQHTYQVLTKRPARRKAWAEWLKSKGGLGIYIRSDEGRPALRHFYDHGTRTEVYMGRTYRSSKDAWAMVMNAAACIGGGPLPNVWEGVSVEDQATADARIPLLLQTPAAKRFISYEPALGPVDFDPWVTPCGCTTVVEHRRLDWLIVGGESGPGARPFDVEWARSTVRQCKAAGVAVFCKQFGRLPFDGHLSDIEILEGEKGRSRPEGQPLTDEEARAIVGDRHHEFPRYLNLTDSKGGDPLEWPAGDWPREFPS